MWVTTAIEEYGADTKLVNLKQQHQSFSFSINDARPKLSSIIENLSQPIIITVNSEPKSVLIRYDEYLRLSKIEQENKLPNDAQDSL